MPRKVVRSHLVLVGLVSALVTIAIATMTATTAPAMGRAKATRIRAAGTRVAREKPVRPTPGAISPTPVPTSSPSAVQAESVPQRQPRTASSRTTPAPTTVAASPTPAAVGSSDFSDNFEGYGANESWADGSSHGGWRSVFNGYGTMGTTVDGSKVLTQSPQASTSSGETHASLAVTTQSFGDIDMTMRVRTVRQLRTPTPNAWETAWVLWDYSDNTHFTYLALKPNGWELGKEDSAYPGAQRFLASGADRKFPVGAWYTVRVRKIGSTVTVWVDGTQLTAFTDSERPYLSGSVGIYNEDAEIHADDVSVRRL